ncbi:hypothetical protein ACPTLS_005780 [Klebsiella pneumoniae]
MDKTERERMLARRRQARRRERLRAEGVNVTVTLTHDEAAQLDELRQVRRMGKQPYSPNEFFQLLLIRNWQQWEKEKAALGTCQHWGGKREPQKIPPFRIVEFFGGVVRGMTTRQRLPHLSEALWRDAETPGNSATPVPGPQ